MTGPAPIIEGINGHREFLLTGEGRPPYVESRSGPFPEAASIETVLNARRNMDNRQEQYGTARTANNLAAVHICTGDLEAALAALRVPKTSSILVTAISIIEVRGSLPTLILSAESRQARLRRALRNDGVCYFDWRTSA
jgi:hypothetical protein